MINIDRADKIAELYIKKLILASEPHFPLWNRENVIFSKTSRWNYIDSCMIKAVTMLYELSNNERLIEYAEKFTGAYVEEDGTIPTMNPRDFNLDNINGGKNLIFLYRITGTEKYRLACEWIYREQLSRQPRLACGSFFHKAVYPFQLWLDGAYMALPFMADYAVLHNDEKTAEDVYLQLENIRRLMRDEKTGLYYHGFDETKSMLWADRRTGLSGEFWLRSIGWLGAALADLCEISKDFSERLFILSGQMLSELTDSLSNFITADNMLLQLPTRSDIVNNYPETSGTLLTAYSSLKAHRLGICGEKTGTFGEKLFSAVLDGYVDIDENELPILKNICLVAGLGGEPFRNGSPEYYLGEPVVENDAKGIAPLLMAYSELKKLNSKKKKSP